MVLPTILVCFGAFVVCRVMTCARLCRCFSTLYADSACMVGLFVFVIGF
jgi:hypothetical protein